MKLPILFLAILFSLTFITAQLPQVVIPLPTSTGGTTYIIVNTTVSNNTLNWINMNSVNATQMQNNGGVLNILESWILSVINFWFNSITNLIKGIWQDNNVNGLLISNGSAIGYNETVFNNSVNIVVDNSAHNFSKNQNFNANITNSRNSSIGYYNNGSCIFIGNLNKIP